MTEVASLEFTCKQKDLSKMFMPLICHDLFPIGCHRPYEFTGKSIIIIIIINNLLFIIFIDDFLVTLIYYQ